MNRLRGQAGRGGRRRFGAMLAAGVIVIGVALPAFGQSLEAPGGAAGTPAESGLEAPAVSEADRGKMTDVLLAEAQEAYQQGRYERAVALYELILERGIRNGHLYYNLGNAWQRLGKVGPSIYHYRRAQLYLPRDGDVEANLAYARARARDRIEPFEEGWAGRVFFWHDTFGDFELFWAAVVFNLVFWGALMARWVRRAPALRGALVLSGLGAVLSVGSLAARAWQYTYVPAGVVLGEEVSVRSGTDVNSVRLFLLHGGSEVRTREQAGDWVQIELPDGKRGWAERRFIGLVRP